MRALTPALLAILAASPAAAAARTGAGPGYLDFSISSAALLAPAIGLSSMAAAQPARLAFSPMWEVFRDSGTPWPAGLSLTALWVYNLPYGANLDGAAFAPGPTALVMETGEDSFRHVGRRLKPDGSPLSEAAFTGFVQSIAAGDLAGRPVVIAQDMYQAQALSLSGRPLWKKPVSMESPRLCDVDGDGKGELVGIPQRIENKVTALRGDGKPLWTAAVPADYLYSVACADLGPAEGPRVAVFAAHKGRATVFILDGKGRPVLDFPDPSAPELGAFTRSAAGTPVLVHLGSEWRSWHDRLRVSELQGHARALSAEADIGPAHAVSLALADLDGNGVKEIVLGTDNGWILVYGLDGRLLSQRHYFGSVSHLAARDADFNGREEVLAGIRGTTSHVYLIGLARSPFAAIAVKTAVGASGGAPPAPPPSWSDEARDRILDLLRNGPEGPVVFAADGTLWSRDTARGFLTWLVKTGKLLEPKNACPAGDDAKAYACLTAALAGAPEKEIGNWAGEYFAARGSAGVRRALREMIGLIRETGREVWLVSSSSRWLAAGAAEILAVEPERAVGAELDVKDGLLTPKLKGPVPCGAGAVAAVKKAVGRRPVMVFGASDDHRDLMLYGAGPAVLVTDAEHPAPALSALARKKGWVAQELPFGRRDGPDAP